MKEITAKQIDSNLINMIANEWMLVSAGDESGYNMMTASWGGMGEMWNKMSLSALSVLSATLTNLWRNPINSLFPFTAIIKRFMQFAAENQAKTLIKPPKRDLFRNLLTAP